MAATMANSTDELLICDACGTQFDETDRTALTSCRICDDPRQFVPPAGQSFSTLGTLKVGSKYNNKHLPFAHDARFTSIWTEPKIGIGQRCVLIQTPHGNVLWDCITYLDAATVEWINSLGGLAAIVISHPHYYSTHLLWAQVFGCKVYLSQADSEWLNRKDDGESPARTFITDDETAILGKNGKQTGVLALKLGGHFPGSLVTLYDGALFIADTLVTTPSGLGNWGTKGRPHGMNSFGFYWSIPNMIPLPPDEIVAMWKVLKKYSFKSTHGAFVSSDIAHDDIKTRVLESMKIQIRGEGHHEHAFLIEE